MISRYFPVITTLLLASTPALGAPVTIGNPPAPPIDGQGTGLCEAAAESIAPSSDFGFLNVGNYINAINTFIESHKDGPVPRTERVVRTVLDLSNNNNNGGQQVSYGDFVDVAAPACKSGGCDFAIGNDDSTSFGSRLRGYFNVTAELVGQPVHFGIFADDAVSLSLFDKNGNSFTVLIQPPELGAPTWRMTETVTFEAPGLYPIEILYVEIAADAALEVSYFIGDFTDFQRIHNQDPVVPLDDSGFSLLAPTQFFQAVSGAPSFAGDLDQCQQCNRQFVNLPGNGDCTSGYYCNEAALCAPCDTALFCGPTCSPCGGGTPFCEDVSGTNECVECRDDNDCPEGRACDPDSHTCQECLADTDCGRGESCVDNTCTACNAVDACAGNSCNCCPVGPSGTQMECADVDGGDNWACVECTQNGDCPNGVCDALVGHCVAALAGNERPDCCGDGCVECPGDFPFCLPGPFGTACAQCRWDTDCGDGDFCLSGQCMPCTTDQHCGPRCGTCGGDTPYCAGQIPNLATCVRCTEDGQCGGGTCNLTTHECEAGECTVSCADGTHCYGQQCVECYADTQCPCGGTCDVTSLTCSESCKSNADCLGTQHCRWDEKGTDKECALGPMPGDAACGSTVTCAIAVGGTEGTPLAELLLLLAALLALETQRRRRGVTR